MIPTTPFKPAPCTPKVPKLEDAQEVLKELHAAGFHAVIAGGGARDTYLGRTPKDYDIVMLGGNSGTLVLSALQAEGFECAVYGIDTEETYTHNEGAPPSHLDWVIKVWQGTTSVDVIQQSCAPACARGVVEAFDVSLNMAWFDDAGRVQVHEDFPKPGGLVKVLRLCDVPHKRIPYLASKFPEYQWPTTNTEGN